MTSPTESSTRSTRSRTRRNPLRAVLALLVIVAVTGGFLAGFVWWEERPLGRARDLLEAGEPHRAMAAIDRFLREHPGHGGALTLKARAFVDLGQPAAAIDLFERVGAADPEAMHDWARALLHQQQWTAALPVLEYLETTGVDRADVLHELAACRAKLGNYDGALQAAEQFAEQPGCRARGLLLIGTIHQERGNLRQTASAWGDVLKLEPHAEGLQSAPVDFFFEYGRVLLTLGESEPAIELLQRSLELEERSETLIELGEAFTQVGDADQAEAAYQRALRLSPTSLKARTGLAQLELSNGDPQAALDWLSFYLTPDRADAESAFLLQRIYVQLGELDQAEQWRATANRLREEKTIQATADQVLRDYPETQWATVLRAYRFAENKNWDEARRLLEPLASQAEDQPFIQELYTAVQTRGELPSLEKLPTNHY